MYNEMIARLILTIGSGIFLSLLAVCYFSKRSSFSLRISLYKWLMFFDFLLIISQLVAYLYIAFATNIHPIVSIVLFRLYWVVCIPWFLFLYFYCLAYLFDYDVRLRDFLGFYVPAKIYTIFTAVCFIAFFFLPLFIPSSENSSYFYGGLAVYFTSFYCLVTVVWIGILLFNYRRVFPKHKIVTVLYLLLELGIFYILQMIFQSIFIMAIGNTLQILLLYFMVENPDLLYISQIDKLKKDVDKANRTKSDFLSNMSHEIRTPMNAIVGFSETILNDTTFNKESVINDIRHIEASSRNLIDIIKNILDVSKIESGNETLEKKDYSLGSILLELDSIIQSRIQTKHIKLLLDIDHEIPSKLRGDPTKVFQILLNILTNAVKYTEVGKIKLVVTKNIEKDKVRLNFRISDTGFGIKKEDYDKMFEKFSRLDMATTNEIEGTGLGLVITKRYVDLMGGKIWFESEYGVGTTFYVELVQPIVDASPLGDIVEPKNEEAKEKTYLDCSSYNILIVDDNKLNLKVASRLLGAYKFNIDTANGGSECVYKFKEGNHYDMIFLDHMMPEMDGIEVLHIIKKLDGYFVPPMVALTANAITGVREMYLKEGFDEYLSKPIDTNELNRLILKYFDK